MYNICIPPCSQSHAPVHAPPKDLRTAPGPTAATMAHCSSGGLLPRPLGRPQAPPWWRSSSMFSSLDGAPTVSSLSFVLAPFEHRQ